MNPSRCVLPHEVQQLTELPNIGPALAAYLRHIGIAHPQELKGCDPYALYHELCVLDCTRYDPCVLDVFISVVRFMDGQGARPWWAYTAERKARLASANS